MKASSQYLISAASDLLFELFLSVITGRWEVVKCFRAVCACAHENGRLRIFLTVCSGKRICVGVYLCAAADSLWFPLSLMSFVMFWSAECLLMGVACFLLPPVSSLFACRSSCSSTPPCPPPCVLRHCAQRWTCSSWLVSFTFLFMSPFLCVCVCTAAWLFKCQPLAVSYPSIALISLLGWQFYFSWVYSVRISHCGCNKSNLSSWKHLENDFTY